MEQQTLFKVRDKRKRGWFWLDNEYINGYGKVLGATAVAIYVNLCRHCDNDQKCFPAEKTIAKELNLTDKTIRKYLKLFEKYHLVEITKERSNTGKWLNNTYWLLDKSEWIKPTELITDGKPSELNSQAIGTKQPSHRNVLPTKEDPLEGRLIKKKTHFSSFKKNERKRPFYRGDEMRFSKGKWWVLPQDGSAWLEFAGSEKDIEWK